MLIWTRRGGSQRTSEPLQIEFCPNTAGQGWVNYIKLKDEEGKFYFLQPECRADYKELLSQAHILYHYCPNE